MATPHSQSAARIAIVPAIFVLPVWMLVRLRMALHVSFAE